MLAGRRTTVAGGSDATRLGEGTLGSLVAKGHDQLREAEEEGLADARAFDGVNQVLDAGLGGEYASPDGPTAC